MFYVIQQLSSVKRKTLIQGRKRAKVNSINYTSCEYFTVVKNHFDGDDLIIFQLHDILDRFTSVSGSKTINNGSDGE